MEWVPIAVETQGMLGRAEDTEVHKALVAELANSVVPTLIMGTTLVSVGGIATIELRSVPFFWLTVVAAIASLAKIGVIAHHRRRNARHDATLGETRILEVAHACTTWSMASTIGAIGALLFSYEDLAPHLIATALLFGYCSGIVSRVSIRPRIAAIALTLAAVPCLTAAFLVNTMPHYIVAAIFLAFLLGAMESIRHAHRNASRHIAMRLQMAQLARTDPLTQLLNRFGLRDRFDAIPRSGRVALHAFDLDGFKAVNDRYGHAVGDEVLSQIADRLRVLLTDDDIIARIGGDEFVVVQSNVENDVAVGVVARRIHELLVYPYELSSGLVIKIGVSLGYAARPASMTSLESLLRDADRTSYIVKRAGGGFRDHRA
jgi:diguanylate cyclase (GGDEF)-like protein